MLQEDIHPKKFQKADLRVISTLKIPAHAGVQIRLGSSIGKSQSPIPSCKWTDGCYNHCQHGFSISVCITWLSESLLPRPSNDNSLKLQDEDITIPRCSNIGYIKNLKTPYFDKILKVKPNEWEAKV
jgi:hypothetical protein